MSKIILLNSTIGNDGDLSPRVRASLESGKFFAVEDTRWFKEFKGRLGINHGEDVKVYSLHEHTDKQQVDTILRQVKGNELFVLSEAGSPIVSDPAFPLIRSGIKEGFKIESLSGVSSVLQALEISGLPPYPFSFHGFFPRETEKRKSLVSELGKGTHIFFESPKRIQQAIKDLKSVYGGDIVVTKELSKTFETVYRYNFEEDVFENFLNEIDPRGEFVFLIHIPNKGSNTGVSSKVKEIAEEILKKGSKPKQIAKLIGQVLNIDSKEVYEKLSK